MSGEYTRREVVFGAGSLLAAAWCAGTLGSRQSGSYVPAENPRLVPGETDTAYPLVTYNDHGGPFEPTMPVNVRFDLTGSDLEESAVEAVLGASPEWTPLLADLDDQWPLDAVDRPVVRDGSGRLALPTRSYRRLVSLAGPTVGYHVHLWPIRVDGELLGLAANAHTDVGTALDHLGARYDEAADRLAAPFLEAGWRETGAAFEFGVDDGQRDHWGPTGDRWLRPAAI